MKIRSSITFLTVIVLVVCGAASVARGHYLMQLRGCIANMKQICSAKESYGLEHKLPVGQRVSLERILGSRPRPGFILELCSARGTCEPGLFTGGKDLRDARDAPRCSVHGSLAVFESSSISAFPGPHHYFAVSAACFVAAVLLILRYVAARGRAGRQPTQ